jgi:zeaxanthin glucosyltransferase
MDAKKIVFLVYHGRGHFNACFKPAKILRENGFEIVFAGFAYFKDYVLQQGFDYYALQTVPFGLGFERWVNTIEKKKNLHWQVIKDRWTDRLYHLREKELRNLLIGTNANYVLIDSWQSTDFVALYAFLKSKNIKVGFIQTMVSTWINPEFPPVTSPVMPDDTREVRKAISRYFRQKLKKRLIDKLKYFTKDNDAIVNKRIRLNGIPAKYSVSHHAVFSRIFSQVDEFVLAPLEFEFNNFKSLAHQHYIGWMLDEARIETADQDYRNAEAEILHKIKKQKLIYCSFGSTDLEDVSGASMFLKKLIEVVLIKNYVCIISSGSSKISEFQKIKIPDVYFFNNVPQMFVLKHASVFITHGGLNSIKEAVHAEVPMLVYPVTEDSDLQGNSARVVTHQLGLRGDATTDSVNDIESKIAELINNSKYRSSVREFRLTEKKYTAEKFIQVFLQLKSIE